MAWEIERKFLVDTPPDDLTPYRCRDLRQGYLTPAGMNTVVRLRKDGTEYVQTVKQGAGLKRREVEVDLTQDQFNTFWPLTEGRRLEKVRYEIPLGAHCIELDVYQGALASLVIAEIEFEAEEDAAAFEPPPWFGPEVTEDVRYANLILATHGLPSPP